MSSLAAGCSRAAADFAHKRNLPLVADEDFMQYPPRHSRLMMMSDGRRSAETGMDAAIGHWGIMLKWLSRVRFDNRSLTEHFRAARVSKRYAGQHTRTTFVLARHP